MTKIDKSPQSFIKIWPKTVLFRNIALIFSLEKPCYLENRVVRGSCKRRTACTYVLWKKGSEFRCTYITFSVILGTEHWPHCGQTCFSYFNIKRFVVISTLPGPVVVIIIWWKLVTELFLQKLYFLFLKILYSKENEETCNICFEVRSPRKRK